MFIVLVFPKPQVFCNTHDIGSNVLDPYIFLGKYNERIVKDVLCIVGRAAPFWLRNPATTGNVSS